MNSMKTVNRFVEATTTKDYILPAIQLKAYNVGSEVKRYGNRAIHIGLDQGDGKVVCLCGKHHNRDNVGDWITLDDVEEYPNITCGACLRSMRKLIRNVFGTPHLVIVRALRQKLSLVKYHVKSERPSTSSDKKIYEVEPESRIVEGEPESSMVESEPEHVEQIEAPIHAFPNRAAGNMQFVIHDAVFTKRIEVSTYTVPNIFKFKATMDNKNTEVEFIAKGSDVWHLIQTFRVGRHAYIAGRIAAVLNPINGYTDLQFIVKELSYIDND